MHSNRGTAPSLLHFIRNADGATAMEIALLGSLALVVLTLAVLAYCKA